MDVTTNNTKSKVNIRLLVGTGMLSGLAFVLQYLEFPIPIMPFFIRFDYSRSSIYRNGRAYIQEEQD